MEQLESRPRKISNHVLLAGGVIGGLALLLVVSLVLGGGANPTVTPQQNINLRVLLPAAFLAGMLSFLSPCTLPLLPAYFAFSVRATEKNVTVMTVAFFLGLATTLTLLGASATALSGLVFQNLNQLTVIGGIAIMVLGVFSFMGKGFAGPQMQERPAATLVGSYLYGAVFSLGWTACVGPILGAILTLLATQGGAVLQGALLAFVYALGLGMPLILVATFFSRLGHGSRFWQIIKGRGFEIQRGRATLHLHTTSMLSGVLLIGMGYLLASGQLTTLTQLAAGSDLSLWVVEMEERMQGWLGFQ